MRVNLQSLIEEESYREVRKSNFIQGTTTDITFC